MITNEYKIQVEGSLPYAKLRTYLWEKSPEIKREKRPMILICPGGGYEFTSDREADPLAVQFLQMGYQVAILRYSVAPAEYPTALFEACQSMKLIREHEEEWGIDTNQIYILGCSAGGHLAASVGVFWNESWIAGKLGCKNELFRPAGMILCYPVITSGEYAHRGSFKALLKSQYTEEMLEKMSLEKQVSKDTPKAFLWHTYTDDCVPVENSLLFIQAMKKFEIPVEFHMYPVGGHGLSTCDSLAETPDGYGVQKECQSWLPLVREWLKASVKEK
ncbi:MAG: alpha/beta hydrolase [Clostridiales bacterium]|nr:alpha/beta hydrolase [Clostridiales bacterium]